MKISFLKYERVNLVYLVSVIISFALIYLNLITIKVPVFFTFVWFCISAWGSLDPNLKYYIDIINKVETENKVVAITFDDGPSEFTKDILATLNKYKAKATFFCVGHKIEKNRDIIEEILKYKHEIANHSYSHSNFIGFYLTRKLLDEVRKTKELLNSNNNFYRPPVGITNPFLKEVAEIEKLKIIGWNIRSLDTVLKDEDKIFERIVKQLSPGSIILLHDTTSKSKNVLERLLSYLQNHHYKTKTVSELIKS